MGDVIDARARWAERSIGARIMLARLERGLTQAQLAEAAGMSLAEIEACEGGPNRIGPVALEKVAAALRIPVSDLLGKGDYGEGALPTAAEMFALLRAVMAIPAPLRSELRRVAETLARQAGEA
jgi:transcriptional regulator with XRE-family HTH domain